MVGVEELVGEGEALFGADFGALGALDALGDVDADFFVVGGLDGVGGAYADAEVAADAGFAVVGHFAAEFFGGGDGGVEGGLSLLDVLEDSGDGGGGRGGGGGVGGERD